jgi:hypothetical protein
MDIIELANKCGIKFNIYGRFYKKAGVYELEDFAQAVIEGYKTRLCEMTHVNVYDEEKGMERSFKLKSPLYALPIENSR